MGTQICHSSRGEVTMSDFPTIKSTHSLVAKYVTKPIWDKLSSVKTATSGFTLAQAIACAVEFDNQHCGIYAGDWDSYKDFAEVFDPLIQEYHGISAERDPHQRHGRQQDQGQRRPRRPRALLQDQGWSFHRRIRPFPWNHQGAEGWSREPHEEGFRQPEGRPCWHLLSSHWHGREGEAAAG